jgi:hypothetical protein
MEKKDDKNRNRKYSSKSKPREAKRTHRNEKTFS